MSFSRRKGFFPTFFQNGVSNVENFIRVVAGDLHIDHTGDLTGIIEIAVAFLEPLIDHGDDFFALFPPLGVEFGDFRGGGAESGAVFIHDLIEGEFRIVNHAERHIALQIDGAVSETAIVVSSENVESPRLLELVIDPFFQTARHGSTVTEIVGAQENPLGTGLFPF